jgi:GNAT superfamily N-acetyltransferase
MVSAWQDRVMSERLLPIIRDALDADAPAACEVLRRSIVELCIADHREDPALLARWLTNKTPETVASWIAQPTNSVLVATDGATLLAVGSVTDQGEIGLNYVSPRARFRGVSKALVSALERRAAERGNARCTLTSTETAHRFYRSVGYRDRGPAIAMFGMRSYPMEKPLV